MKVFVTGHRGYIGVHLVELLKEAGHGVTGCDLGLYDECEWEPCARPDDELIKDVRNLQPEELDGHDAICHLAAISNDPMGDLNPRITYSINRDASIMLARLAKAAGVGRYLFSGSCSVYGRGQKLDLKETDELNPLTVYARSKTETELAVSSLADSGFTPIYLRNATAYGHSPMLRIDLVANNLLGSALAYNQIRIHSDGSPWRPLIHCRDIARAFVAFLDAPREDVHDKSINIGHNDENYQVRDVANLVEQIVPTAKVQFAAQAGEDPRNYRVNFDLLGRILPEFELEFDLLRGMIQLHRKMVDYGFGPKEFEGRRFVRLRTLTDHLNMLGVA